jgi:hypothetical protein
VPGHFKTLWKSRSTSTPPGQLAQDAAEYIYSTRTESVKWLPTFRRNSVHLSPNAKGSKKNDCLCKNNLRAWYYTAPTGKYITLRLTEMEQIKNGLPWRYWTWCDISASAWRYWETQRNLQSGYVISEPSLAVGISYKGRKKTTHLAETLGKECSTYSFSATTLTAVTLNSLEKIARNHSASNSIITIIHKSCLFFKIIGTGHCNYHLPILRSAHTAYLCFVWISEQTVTFFLYSIKWLVFITETGCVYCAVRTECLCTIQLNIGL